jgi:hypothetical protein
MEPKAKIHVGIEKIDKYISYKLPHKFKAIGLIISITSWVSLILIEIYFGDDKYFDLFKRIAITIVILGLLIISTSREKIEDELIAKIRMQSYHFAVLGTILLYLIMPFFDFTIVSIFSSMPKIEGSKDVSILICLLITQILTFRTLKKAYNEE